MGVTGSILFIDDEAEWRETIVRLLTSAGYEAEAAAELEEAEERLGTRPFDVLLVDRLFGSDYSRGLEIIRSLKGRHPEQEVILLTSHLDVHAVRDVFGNDAHAALEKGNSAALLEELRRVFLKKALRLGRLRRPFDNAFLTESSLADLRDDLFRADDPRACFLDVIALAGALAAAGRPSAADFRRIVSESGLAAELPHLGSLDDGGLGLLADIAPHALETLELDERGGFCAGRSIFTQRRDAIRARMVAALVEGQPRPLSDQARVAACRDLLRASRSVVSVGAEVVLPCLLNEQKDRAASDLNLPSLIRLHAGKLLGPLEEVVDLLRSQPAPDGAGASFQAIARLIEAQRHYTAACFAEAGLKGHADWLIVYTRDVIPLMAAFRQLAALAPSVPAVAKACESIRVLLRRLNDRFVDFVCDAGAGYTAWVGGDRASRPMMTPDVLREAVLPALDSFRTVYLIIFDGMSMLSWSQTRERSLRPIFEFISDDAAMAVLPTATRYARSAIFAGAFPREFMGRHGPGGLNERKLLNEGLARLGAGVTVAERDFMKFEARHDAEEDRNKRRELDALIESRARLKAIIFDPHDKVTHIAPGHVEDFAELFYEVAIHHVMVRLSQSPGTGIVLAVDHGFCEIQELKAVRGIFVENEVRDSDTHYEPKNPERGGHFGKRYIDLGTRQFNPRYATSWLRFGSDPARWALPDSNGYLFAVGPYGFGRDTGQVRMFAHGGISLEEMMVPVAILASRAS